MRTSRDTDANDWTKLWTTPSGRLTLILWLVAVHSFFVGLGLILLSDDWLSFFGFTGGERFFRAQAGVFHFVMVVLYLAAAFRRESSRDLTHVAIAAKFMAMAFLISYFLFAVPIWMVLLSGIGDGAMGILILWAFLVYRRSSPAASAQASG
jgi:hypothetical protein